MEAAIDTWRRELESYASNCETTFPAWTALS